MADRVCWYPSDDCTSGAEPAESSFLPGPAGKSDEDVKHHSIKAALPEHTTSSSPLRNVDTNRISPRKARPVLRSATNSVASRASSVHTNGLDDIPEERWARIASIRTANTPEISNPDLSIEEITSTKLSLDDQAILADLPNETSRKEAQFRQFFAKTTIDNKSQENENRFKKMTRKIKKIPSGLFNRRDRHPRETSASITTQAIQATLIPEPALPPLDLTTELYVPTERESPNDVDKAEAKSAKLVRPCSLSLVRHR